MLLMACQERNVRTRDSFNQDWKFNLGDVPEASGTDFDDSQWRTLNLPHDWAIEGSFSADNPAGAGGGALHGGEGGLRHILQVRSAGAEDQELRAGEKERQAAEVHAG